MADSPRSPKDIARSLEDDITRLDEWAEGKWRAENYFSVLIDPCLVHLLDIKEASRRFLAGETELRRYCEEVSEMGTLALEGWLSMLPQNRANRSVAISGSISRHKRGYNPKGFAALEGILAGKTEWSAREYADEYRSAPIHHILTQCMELCRLAPAKSAALPAPPSAVSETPASIQPVHGPVLQSFDIVIPAFALPRVASRAARAAPIAALAPVQIEIGHPQTPAERIVATIDAMHAHRTESLENSPDAQVLFMQFMPEMDEVRQISEAFIAGKMQLKTYAEKTLRAAGNVFAGWMATRAVRFKRNDPEAKTALLAFDKSKGIANFIAAWEKAAPDAGQPLGLPDDLLHAFMGICQAVLIEQQNMVNKNASADASRPPGKSRG